LETDSDEASDAVSEEEESDGEGKKNKEVLME